MIYEKRFYRDWTKDSDLSVFNVKIKETDLQIFAESDLRFEAHNLVKKYRTEIEDYIKMFPIFKNSLIPLTYLKKKESPDIVNEMLINSEKASVGPMATVAGAISEFIGLDLLKFSNEVIVENGGDLFIYSKKKRIISIYSGKNSKFSNKIGIEIDPNKTPLGICTSSGTVGHSLSFGLSDAVIVISESTVLADGVATFLGNKLCNSGKIEEILQLGMSIKGVRGVVLIIEDKIGVLGDIKLIAL